MSLPPFLTQNRQILERTCRAKAQAVPMPDDVLLARCLGDLLIYLDGRDRTFTPWCSLTSYWEAWVTLSLARMLKEGWYVLDLGAHQGYYTLLSCLAVGPTGRVLAVEPQPGLAKLCRWSIEVNGFNDRALVIDAAVAATVGEMVSLVCDTHHRCNATIVRDLQKGECVTDVPTTTVDELTQEWPRLDLIKCDIEGSEEAAFAGMQRTLARHPDLCLVVEVNSARYPDPEKFYRSLAEHFVLRYIDMDGGVQPVTIARLLTEHPQSDWMLCLRKT
jgi:FkbM family methyltransferase